MTNTTITIIFIVGIILGCCLGLLGSKPKKVGTIEFTQYDDGGRTTCQITFDVSPDELAPLKNMLFDARWKKFTSQK